MSQPMNEKRSIKDRITSHLPGKRNQDRNRNGIPDRLETRNGVVLPATTKTTQITRTGTLTNISSAVPFMDRNANGIPDYMEKQPISSTTDLNRNGIPDSLERAQVSTTSATDLNRNGIPDQLEGQRSFGQTGMTDLNRNGIPDQLEGQGFGFVGSVPTVQTSVVDVREAPTIIEKIEKPAVVHEVIKTEETIQIQPIIERERDQTDVYEIVQPMREVEIEPTVVTAVTLPAQIRPTIIADGLTNTTAIPATDVAVAEQRAVVERAPIVKERIVHRIVEEIWPVIYREVPASMAHQYINRAVAEAEIERTTTTTVGSAQVIGEELRIGQLTGNLQGVNMAELETYVREQIRTGNYTESTTVTKSVEHVTMASQTVATQTAINSNTY